MDAAAAASGVLQGRPLPRLARLPCWVFFIQLQSPTTIANAAAAAATSAHHHIADNRAHAFYSSRCCSNRNRYSHSTGVISCVAVATSKQANQWVVVWKKEKEEGRGCRGVGVYRNERTNPGYCVFRWF